jgi:hypothetical protein
MRIQYPEREEGSPYHQRACRQIMIILLLGYNAVSSADESSSSCMVCDRRPETGFLLVGDVSCHCQSLS